MDIWDVQYKPDVSDKSDDSYECDEECDCLEWDEEDEGRICGIHLFSGECDGNCGA